MPSQGLGSGQPGWDTRFRTPMNAPRTSAAAPSCADFHVFDVGSISRSRRRGDPGVGSLGENTMARFSPDVPGPVMLCKSPSSAVAAVWTARADVAVVPQFGGSAPDDRVQFRGNETRPDRPYDLRQLQRAGHQIRHHEAKTPGSAAVLPLPDICLTALKPRAERQAADKSRAAKSRCRLPALRHA